MERMCVCAGKNLLQSMSGERSEMSDAPRHPTELCNISCNEEFPDSSTGKESAFNAVDPGLIPGSGSSPGEGIVYPLQYS